MGGTLLYGRILLKLSGEAFSREGRFGIDQDMLGWLAGEIGTAAAAGAQIAVVVGGGNLLRGASVAGKLIGKATADWMGMLATVMNGLALRDALESRGGNALLLSSVPVRGVCDPWSGRRCKQALASGQVAILAGGTGNPHVTTDSAAALRAVEIGAEALLKATKVDGIYTGDPRTCPEAVRYDRLTYEEFLEKKLRALDLAAVALCMDHRMPVVLFNMFESGNISRAVKGEVTGTTLSSGT